MEVKEGGPIRILFLILLVDLLAFTSILPLFPAILDHYADSKDDVIYNTLDAGLVSFRKLIGAPDNARLNSVFFGGLLGSMFSLLQFFSSPIAGALSDVYGRKPVLLVAVSGSLAAYVVWACAGSFTGFLLSRVVGGVAKASVSIATVIVADIYSPPNRSRGMAAVGVAFSVGFLLGPSIGAYFAKSARISGEGDPFALPAYFSIALTIIELILIAAALPETLPPKSRKTSINEVIGHAVDYISPKSLFNFHTLKDKANAGERSGLAGLGRVYFVYLFLYSGLEFTLTFFTKQQFHYDSPQQGRMYFFAGAIMILVQGGYVRRLSGNESKQRGAVMAGLGILIPGFLLIAAASTQTTFYAGLACYSMASGLVVPCMTTLAAGAGSAGEKGAILGTFRSLGALARASGPFAAAAVFWILGPRWCYGIGGVAILIPLAMFYGLHKPKTA